MTITAKIGDAKTQLSELIALAERGERIVIARGDTPVVELRLLDAAQADDLGAALAAVRNAKLSAASKGAARPSKDGVERRIRRRPWAPALGARASPFEARLRWRYAGRLRVRRSVG